MKKGFTIIELLVVMTILIAVTAGSVISYTRMTKDMKEKEYNRIVSEFEAAAEVYVASSNSLRQKIYEKDGYAIISLKVLDSEGLINLVKQKDPITGNLFSGNNFINVFLDDDKNIHAEYMSDADYVFTTPGDIYGIPVGSTYGRDEMLESLIGYYKGEFDQTTGTYNLKNIDLEKVEISVLDITDESAPVEIGVDEILTTTSHLNDTFEITYTYNFPDGEKEIVRKARVSQYTETLLNGTDPVIEGDLIPIKLSSNNNDWTVTYADTTKEWYKYGKSEWANAIRLVSNPSKNYNVGDIIKHDDISAYFVWIPKYKYKLFNMGSYTTNNGTVVEANQLIEIEFGTTNTIDTDTSCTTPMISGESGNCAIGKWMSHPAFLSFNKNGFWVGKFASTGTIDEITILPNEKSITNNTAITYFRKSLLYDGKGSNVALDSHLMKNTEWGAVAYLAHSSYGMGNKNIYINNYYNDGYKTGCVGDGPDSATTTICNLWYTDVGINGSTSGNITGMYDGSGGTWQYMAGVNNSYTGFSDGEITGTNAKYVDIYLNTSNNSGKRGFRILGDATSEMGPFNSYVSSWYGDIVYTVTTTNHWFGRAGKMSDLSGAGLFRSGNNDGGVGPSCGFRIVLTP